MSLLASLSAAHQQIERGLTALQSPALLAARLYVGWQFWKAGVLKYQSWDTTLDLFREEYQVPLLSPEAAAWLGTAGELAFPALLFVGLASRLAALGLSAVNVMAVVAYAHVLFTDGFEAAVGQHVLWGVLLAMIALWGGGRLSLDALLAGRRRTPVGAGAPQAAS
ncbi:MAG: DoxX family protein [Steroidobacteraceae bacterium]